MSSASLPYRPCVGIVLVNSAGLIFTAERLDTPGAWQMPQGGIDSGEEPDSAALRELYEETGLNPALVTIDGRTKDWVLYDLPPHLLGKAWKGKYRGQKQLWYKMQFLGKDQDIDIETEHPEFGRWKWSSPTQVVEEIVEFKKTVYQQVINEFEF
jgi:putative (di)nucleoside polyphosphate hydrolase